MFTHDEEHRIFLQMWNFQIKSNTYYPKVCHNRVDTDEQPMKIRMCEY